MKTIQLRSLILSNFKGMKDLSVTFGNNTDISADNRVGKTTIFDAFTWLLFGKDSLGRADFDIKTLRPDGTVIHDLDHSVRAVIEIDERPIILQRSLRENWVKRRGSIEAVLQGHTTQCHWDEVPVSVSDFNGLVNGICPEELFRLITDPLFFNTRLDKKAKRKMLEALAGNIEPKEVAKSNPAFPDLLSRLGKTTMENYGKILAEKSKRLKTAIKDITPRIDENDKTMPKALDWPELESSIRDAEAGIARLKEAHQNKPKANQEQLEKHYKEISLLQSEIHHTVQAANKRETEGAKKDNVYLVELRTELAKLRNTHRSLIDTEFEQDRGIERLTHKINVLEEDKARKVEEWKAVNAQTYTESAALVCPIYKHPCSDQTAIEHFALNEETARLQFNTNKVELVRAINADGATLAARIQETKTELAELERLIAQQTEQREGLEKHIHAVEMDIAEHPERAPIQYTPETLPACEKDLKDITQLKAIIETIQNPPVDAEEEAAKAKTEADISALQQKIQTWQQQLAVRDQIKRQKERIMELNQERDRYADELNGVERDLHTIQLFTMAMAEELDARINSKFDWVRFRLWEVQLNEGIKETCDTIIDGVPYSSANNEARINAGIDIINALSEHHEISAPIWIDNRESVNELHPTGSQLINLIVSKEKVIKVSINS